MKKIIILIFICAIYSCGHSPNVDPLDGWMDLGTADVTTSSLPVPIRPTGSVSFGGILPFRPDAVSLTTTSSYNLYVKSDGYSNQYALKCFADNNLLYLRMIPESDKTITRNGYECGYLGYNYEGITDEGKTIFVSIKKN